MDFIRYLCKEISAVEWSGTIFYKKTSDSLFPKDFDATLHYIHPMHKGSSAYTEFDADDSQIDLMEDHPEETEDCYTGLIHSHNNMGVFFSGTDMKELQDNVENYDQYLSVIVNNKMEIELKVAMVGKRRAVHNILLDRSGNAIAESADEAVWERVMYTFTPNVFIEDRQAEIPDHFRSRVVEICKPKPVAVTPTFPTYPRYAGEESTYRHSSMANHSEPTFFETINKLANYPYTTDIKKFFGHLSNFEGVYTNWRTIDNKFPGFARRLFLTLMIQEAKTWKYPTTHQRSTYLPSAMVYKTTLSDLTNCMLSQDDYRQFAIYLMNDADWASAVDDWFGCHIGVACPVERLQFMGICIKALVLSRNLAFGEDLSNPNPIAKLDEVNRLLTEMCSVAEIKLDAVLPAPEKLKEDFFVKGLGGVRSANNNLANVIYYVPATVKQVTEPKKPEPEVPVGAPGIHPYDNDFGYGE